MTSQRKSVKTCTVREDRLGPVNFLEITYVDGRITYAVSYGGIINFYGRDKLAATEAALANQHE